MGADLRWCEGYEDRPDMNYHNMLKSHDFDLALEVPPGWDVIVQVRHPFEAVTSWFNTQTSRYGWEDSYEHWSKWAPTAFLFWNRFVRRWVTSGKAVMVIDYEDLLANTDHYVRCLMWILSRRTVLTHSTNPKPKRDYKDFRYYRPSDFEWFKTFCRAEMRLIGYD